MENTQNKPLVVIRCITYNHEPYIRDCLNGFVMQKTTFPFVAVVHDDASTDKTADIIREYAEKYPDIIKPIYETENQYSKHDGSLDRIMDKAVDKYAPKYVAYCEGDDYWIDYLKLQKQIEVMENDEEILMVYTGFNTIDEHGKKEDRPDKLNLMKRSFSGDIFEEMLNCNFVMTLTTCFRYSVISSNYIRDAPVKQDYLLSLFSAASGKCIYLPQKTANYRNSPNGMMNKFGSLVYEKNLKIFAYIARLYKKKIFFERSLETQKNIERIICKKMKLYRSTFAKKRIKKILCFLGRKGENV